MSKRVNYQKLKTMDDLRAERIRINNEIARTEWKLQDDYEGLTEVFTLDFWLNSLLAKVPAVAPGMQWVSIGYELIGSLFQRRNAQKTKRKKKKKKNKAVEIVDIDCNM